MKFKTALRVMFMMLGVPSVPWAFCVAGATSYISVGVINLTGYPLTVDLTNAAPDYHDSGVTVTSFPVGATPQDNLAWQPNVIHIDSCFEMGSPASGTGTLKFNFPNADQGEKGGALGPVMFSLSYSASWDSNRQGMNPEIKSLNITQNIFDTVPGVSPITGVAQFVHADSSNYAYLDIVFYDLAPGLSGNQNIRRPFDPFFASTATLPESR